MFVMLVDLDFMLCLLCCEFVAVCSLSSFGSISSKKKKLPSKTPLRKKVAQMAQLETEIDDLLG
jgi:hypothetical protein